MNFSTSEENYIKSIYHLQVLHGKVNTSILADTVQTKAASATDMLKKLHKKKLLDYEPYKRFMLTEAGVTIALNIIRKHRLWEFFLVNKLGFNWEQVHDIAEELEHINSIELITRLDEFLGHPSFDPHGDPIPNSKGKMADIKRISLTDLPLKKTATVSYIKDQSKAMLDLLKHYHISIGTKIKVCRKFEFDGSVEINTNEVPGAVLSNLVAKNIYCVI
jgi:DtxR family transcriptional regulator, Mn-dependent transcriptional regulator